MDYGYEMIKEILETATYFVMCFQILGLPKKDKKYFWGIMILAHIVVWGGIVFTKGDFMLIVPICTLLQIALPVSVAEGKRTKRIAASFFSYTVIANVAMIVELVLTFALSINPDTRWIISILIVLSVLIILYIIQSIYKISFIDVNRISTVILLILGLFCFGVSGFISNILRNDFNSQGAVSINIFVMSVLIASFILCFAILLVTNHKKANMAEINMANESIIESQKKYVQEILGDRDEIRGMYHDLNKIVLTLDKLFESGRHDEALQTLKRLNQNLNGNQHQFVYTNDGLLDAIISQYAGIAEKHNIAFHVTLKAEQKPELGGYDFCIILSNLLSNAMEAAAMAEDKRQVSLQMKQNQDQWYIRVENTYHADLSNTAFSYSTKSGSKHGYGIRNIRAAVDRLGGEICFDTEGEYVTAEVFLVEK